MATKLRSWVRSIRFRLSIMYSAAVFGVGGLGLGLVYLLVRNSLRDQILEDLVVDGTSVRVGIFTFELPRMTIEEVTFYEGSIQEIIFTEMAKQTLFVLIGLFVLSLFLGWWIAGRTLRPIDRIATVASEISGSDLSRRINLSGPDDELSRLANTFDQMLDRLDHAFSHQRRFLAQTSHDLRNPLTIIKSNLDITLANADTTAADWEQIGQIINRAVTRMSTMIEGLLSVARLESGNTVRVFLDFAELVHLSAREQSAVAAERGVTFRLQAERAPVWGDPDSLTRAWENLVRNALAVAPDGSEISLRSGVADGSSFVEISDQGPGMPEEVVEGVYSSGNQGMGLMIAREIARIHHGRLVIASSPSGGAAVRIELPAHSG